MNNNQILKLSPVFKNYLWGGTKLKTEFNKLTNLENLQQWNEAFATKGYAPIYYSVLRASEILIGTAQSSPSHVLQHSGCFLLWKMQKEVPS